MEQCLNIYLDLNSPNKNNEGIPDPSELAKRYGVSDDENDNSDEEDERLSKEKKQQTSDCKPAVENNETNIELLAKVKQHTGKLNEKNKEIDKLCCLLEAMEPVPGGVDPEKFLKMFEAAKNEGKDEIGVDYRDQKIVQLAKKVRKYSLALNKERAANTTSKQTIEELTGKVERLTKELDLISSPAARAAAIRNVRQEIKQNNEETDISELRKEMSSLQKQNEEIRRKYMLVQDDNKKLTRALAKEVGEGVTVNQVMHLLFGWIAFL